MVFRDDIHGIAGGGRSFRVSSGLFRQKPLVFRVEVLPDRFHVFLGHAFRQLVFLPAEIGGDDLVGYPAFLPDDREHQLRAEKHGSVPGKVKRLALEGDGDGIAIRGPGAVHFARADEVGMHGSVLIELERSQVHFGQDHMPQAAEILGQDGNDREQQAQRQQHCENLLHVQSPFKTMKIIQ